MSTTQIVPLVQITEGQLVPSSEFHLALDDLKNKAAMLAPVTDQTTYAEALEVVKQANQEIKTIEAMAEPELIVLRRRLEELRGQRDKLAGEFTQIVAPIEKQARDWHIGENNATKTEEKDLNYGKRTVDRVHVKPNIPSVPGVRIIVKYRCEVLDKNKVKRVWMSPDIKAIEARARKDQDPEKTEKEVGGIRIHQI